MRMLAGLALGWSLCANAAGAAETWLDLPPLPTPRQEVGVGALDGLVYVVGGITRDRAPSAVVERYDPRTREWQRAANLPRALHHAGVASVGGQLYVVGGLDGSFRGVASAYAYSLAGDRWDAVASLPTARGAAGVAVLSGRIFVAGGEDGSGSVADFAAYDPGAEGGRWEELPPMPTARNHLAAAAAGGRFFAVGGRRSGLLAAVEAYDPASREWSARRPIPTPRGGIALAVVGMSIFAFGGEGNDARASGVFPQTERYDPIADVWEGRSDMSVPRHGIGAAVVGDTVFIPGGSEVEGFGVTDASTAYLPDALDLPRFRRGDANLDGGLDIADPIRVLFYLFSGGVELECLDAADADDSGTLAVSDAIAILGRLFLGAGPLSPPTRGESGDSTADLLGC